MFSENMGHPKPMKIVIIKKCPKLLRIYGIEIRDENMTDLYSGKIKTTSPYSIYGIDRFFVEIPRANSTIAIAKDVILLQTLQPLHIFIHHNRVLARN